MKKQKRFISIFLLVFLCSTIASFASCGKNASPNEPTNGTEEEEKGNDGWTGDVVLPR